MNKPESRSPSSTPRTDAVLSLMVPEAQNWALADVARELERERAELEAECFRYREEEADRDYQADQRAAAPSETAKQISPVDPESEAANPVWDLVIAKCHSAYPERQGMSWGESPLELITEIINERDEALKNAGRWRWFVENANLGAFKVLDRSQWNKVVDASIEIRAGGERRQSTEARINDRINTEDRAAGRDNPGQRGT